MTDVKRIGDKFWVVATSLELRRMVEFGDFTENGIVFDGELSGPNGMDFTLFPAPWHTEEDIEAAKKELRYSRDVTGIYMGKYEGEYPLPQELPVWGAEQKEEAFRKIVAERSMGWVDNCPSVDMQSANAVVLLLDNLSPENKVKYLTKPASVMIDWAWELLDHKIEEA